MRLDMTITIGNLLQGAITIAGLFLAYTAIRERLVRIETQMGPLWTEYNDRRSSVRRAEDRE